MYIVLSRLCGAIDEYLPQLGLDEEDVQHMLMIRHCITSRAQQLADVTGAIMDILNDDDGNNNNNTDAVKKHKPQQKISLEDVKQLHRVLEELLTNEHSDFPIRLIGYDQQQQHQPDNRNRTSSVIAVYEESHSADEGGTLLPPPSNLPAGETSIILFIDKIGLKDAVTYLSPHLTVLVTSAQGPPLEQQDTPNTHTLLSPYITYNRTIYLQTSLQKIQQNKLTIFIEFKHYKPAKKKYSTRCFALLEYEEILSAATNSDKGVCLELYKKPTDWSKKNLNLLSVKKLYLHITCQLHQH